MCGRQVGSKDKNLQTRKVAKKMAEVRIWKFENIIWRNWFFSHGKTDQISKVCENKNISIIYVVNEILWNRYEVNVVSVFMYSILLYVINGMKDLELKSIKHYKQRNVWNVYIYKKNHLSGIKLTLLNEKFLYL